MQKIQMEVRDRAWLEKARRVRGCTQAQVADAVGCSVAFYNRIEKGLHTPNVVIALKITDFLEADVRNFLAERIVHS